jgi:hypothetical protein
MGQRTSRLPLDALSPSGGARDCGGGFLIQDDGEIRRVLA